MVSAKVGLSPGNRALKAFFIGQNRNKYENFRHDNMGYIVPRRGLFRKPVCNGGVVSRGAWVLYITLLFPYGTYSEH